MNVAQARRCRYLWVTIARSLGFLLACSAIPHVTPAAWCEEPPRAEGQAPPGFELHSHTRGGAYFVARELKEAYERLRGRIALLKTQIDAGDIEGVMALQELQSLRDALETLRERIDRERVLVEPVKVHTQTETVTFPLGAEQLLVITADNIRVQSWPGPEVKCVLEKTVLGADEQPVEDEFKAIQLVHRHGPASQIVGRSAEERAADEKKFRESPEGQALTPEQLVAREEFVQRIAGDYRQFSAFQGRDIDTIELAGLTYDQGNRQLTIDINSPEGGRTLSSQWRRHATLTVFVPACQAVALRGCRVKVEVESLKAALLLTTQGSRDKDYNGTFRVRNVEGDVTIQNAPLDVLENVRGNVSLIDTVGFNNNGTTYEGGSVTWYTPPPKGCVIRHVAGDLHVWFGRQNVSIEDVQGRIDVRNEFGNTEFRAGATLAPLAHRIVTQSGRIDVTLAASLMKTLPLMVLTQFGAIRTEGFRPENSGSAMEMNIDETLGRRNWHGFRTAVTKESFDPAEHFAAFERVKLALHGDDRPAGLDLMSFAGTISLVVER